MATAEDVINADTGTFLAGLTPGDAPYSYVGVDLSCVGWGSPLGGCVAVGDHTILAAHHVGYDSFTFFKQNDTTTSYIATTIAYQRVGTTDIAVHKVAALPVWVKRAKVLPANYRERIRRSLALYSRFADRNLFAGEWQTYLSIYASLSESESVPEWYSTPIGGDSGSVFGFDLDGEFTAVGHFTTPSAGPSYGDSFGSIQDVMDALVTGDTLVGLDLSEFDPMPIDTQLDFTLCSNGNLVGQQNWQEDAVASPSAKVLALQVQCDPGGDSGAIYTNNLGTFNSTSPWTLAVQVYGQSVDTNVASLAFYLGDISDVFVAATVSFNNNPTPASSSMDVSVDRDGGSVTDTNFAAIPATPQWFVLQYNGTNLKFFYVTSQKVSTTLTQFPTVDAIGLYLTPGGSGDDTNLPTLVKVRLYDVTPQVTGLDSVSATPTTISLSWDFLPGAQTYKIYSSVDGYATAIGTSATTSYTATGLSPDTTYGFKVSAVAGGVEGAKSSAITVPTATPLPPVQNLLALGAL